MKKIKSVEHAQTVLGTQINFAKMREGLTLAGIAGEEIEPLVAHFQLTHIVTAHNRVNKWKADWGDYNQAKYNVWKGTERNPAKPAGFGFSHSGYVCGDANSAVGSRLVVGSSVAALYIGKDFEELFEIAWFIIPKE